MLKSYVKGRHTIFCTNYSRTSTNVCCTLKIGDILNLKKFFRFSYLQLRNIRGHSLNISKTMFPKLLLDLQISYQLHDARLQ